MEFPAFECESPFSLDKIIMGLFSRREVVRSDICIHEIKSIIMFKMDWRGGRRLEEIRSFRGLV